MVVSRTVWVRTRPTKDSWRAPRSNSPERVSEPRANRAMRRTVLTRAQLRVVNPKMLHHFERKRVANGLFFDVPTIVASHGASQQDVFTKRGDVELLLTDSAFRGRASHYQTSRLLSGMKGAPEDVRLAVVDALPTIKDPTTPLDLFVILATDPQLDVRRAALQQFKSYDVSARRVAFHYSNGHILRLANLSDAIGGFTTNLDGHNLYDDDIVEEAAIANLVWDLESDVLRAVLANVEEPISWRENAVRTLYHRHGLDVVPAVIAQVVSDPNEMARRRLAIRLGEVCCFKHWPGPRRNFADVSRLWFGLWGPLRTLRLAESALLRQRDQEESVRAKIDFSLGLDLMRVGEVRDLELPAYLKDDSGYPEDVRRYAKKQWGYWITAEMRSWMVVKFIENNMGPML